MIRSARLRDLAPAVRGEDDARAALAQAAHEPEQPLDLAARRAPRSARRGRGCRGSREERARDLDDLALRERERAGSSRGSMPVDAEALEAPRPRARASSRRWIRPRAAARLVARAKRFSATVIHGNSVSSWKTVPTPSARAACGLRSVDLRRRRRGASRSRAGGRRSRILISVLLPAPFSPTRACTSPKSRAERRVVERADAAERTRRCRSPRSPGVVVLSWSSLLRDDARAAAGRPAAASRADAYFGSRTFRVPGQALPSAPPGRRSRRSPSGRSR